jgi:Branched-chain amino acid transport protein (AzlD).
MSILGWVLASAVTAYAIKLAGYLLPQSLLDRPPVTELAAAMTVGLLASLTMMNTVADGQSLAVDSRLLALAAGAVALKLKAPYLVVVLVGALAAAAGRFFGLP